MGYLLAVGLALLIALSASFFWGERGQRAIERLEAELERQKTVTSMLVDRNEQLRKEVHELATGTYMIEARARRDLGMVRDGETFFQVVDGDELETPATADLTDAD